MTAEVKAGDRFTVEVRSGYRLVQDRPYECHYQCMCGECNGHIARYPGVVTRVIAWADNSIDAEVACDDGQTRTAQIDGPHGDVSF